jgi:predicted nucleotidyltransferase
LEDVLDRARRLLGDDTLVSVVLFGSRARKSSHPGSDFDLLIVARSLSDEAGRRELALDIAEVGFDYGLPVQVVLVSTEETEGAVNTGAPLMFEIHDAHQVIYDKDNFFHNLVNDFTGLLETWQARKIKDRVWEVPGLAAARL